ncbi:hypothetical protein MLD38_021512 [Melastoma candidum]|uniref:Uncharacterized protein n=1 Tax=Melastoma candidum TaxID=119954 RepID=A0ACB9QFQ9_9MYRT|nr:hypothetical protein MLD38_021512 [Melastoma candidum]
MLKKQYERWQPRAYYKEKLDPTIEEVKKLCMACRRSAKTERSYFITMDTVFQSQLLMSYTQYIPLPIPDLDSWLKTPSNYVFDCSAAGLIVNAFVELNNERNTASSSGQPRTAFFLQRVKHMKPLHKVLNFLQTFSLLV